VSILHKELKVMPRLFVWMSKSLPLYTTIVSKLMMSPLIYLEAGGLKSSLPKSTQCVRLHGPGEAQGWVRSTMLSPLSLFK
jgi:hypothetical protein